MSLTQEQQQKARRWMESKAGPHGACPVCGQRTWQFGEIIMGNTVDPQGNITIGASASGVPMLQVVCLNCGHVNLMAAVLMGLIQNSE
jgi:predicted nucleic-acid-binding Zn-ribbon protein